MMEIKEGSKKQTIIFFISLVNSILCFTILNSTSYIFPKTEVLVFSLFTIIVTYRSINFYFESKSAIEIKNLIYVVILSFYIAFGVFGNRLFIYPFDMNIGIHSVLIFMLLTVTIIPIIFFVFHKLLFLNTKNYSPVSRKISYLLFFIIVMFIELVSVIFIIGFNPAISSWDSASQFSQALGFEQITNWHSPFHTLIIRYLLKIINSPVFIAIIQSLYMATIIAYGCVNLLKRGIKFKILLITSFMFALLPNNSVLLVTLWKDIPYTASLVWLVIVISKIAYNNYRSYIVMSIEIILSTSFVFLFRQNGIVVYIFVIVYLLFLSFLRKEKMYLISSFGSILFIMLINGPIYNFYGVENGLKGGKYIGLSQDILAVDSINGEITADALDLVNQLNKKKNYTPYFATSAAPNINMDEFLKIYIATFTKNPTIMIRSILLRSDYFIGILPGFKSKMGTLLFTGNTFGNDRQWAKVHPDRIHNYAGRRNNIVTKLLSKYINLARLPIIRYICGRVGVYTLLVILCISINILRKKYELLVILIPWIGHILSLVLSSGWSEYRYVWPLTIISIYYFFLSITEWKSEDLISISN